MSSRSRLDIDSILKLKNKKKTLLFQNIIRKKLVNELLKKKIVIVNETKFNQVNTWFSNKVKLIVFFNFFDDDIYLTSFLQLKLFIKNINKNIFDREIKRTNTNLFYLLDSYSTILLTIEFFYFYVIFINFNEKLIILVVFSFYKLLISTTLATLFA